MEIAAKLAAVSLVGSIVVLLLKKENPSLGAVLTVAVCGAALVLLLDTVQAVWEVLEEISALCDLAPETVAVVLKAVGIALITQLAAAMCRDFGQQATAAAVELGGGAAILLAGMPLVLTTLQVIEKWLKL